MNTSADYESLGQALLGSKSPSETKVDPPEFSEDDHPPRYNQGAIETIDMMESVALSWEDLPKAIPSVTTAIKYIDRAPHKGDPRRDIHKAIWYLNRALQHLGDGS